MTAKKFWSWFLLAWALTACPLLLLHGVPGVDTPNHVARLHVLASLAQNDSFRDYYRVHWALLPNLAVDLFITPIVYLFHIEPVVLMKIFLINMIGITGIGYAVLNRALSGKWSAWGISGLLLAYGYVLGFGFINYLFGIGLGLLFVGVQLWLKDRPNWRFLVVAIGFPILLLNHLMALGLAVMAVVVIAIWQRDKSRDLWLGFGVGTFLCLVYMKLSAAPSVRSRMWYDGWLMHTRNAIFPLYFSNFWLDLAFWLAVLALACWLGWRSKKGRLALCMAGVFVVTAMVLPHMAMTSAFLSGRVSIWTALVAGACLEDISIGPWPILAMLAVRSIDIGIRFLGWNSTFDQLRQDLNVVPNQSLMYQMVSMKANPLTPTGWYPSILHADCLWLLDHSGYVNNMFSQPFQQPMQTAPEIGPDLRDLYAADKEDIEKNRQWILWQIGLMSPRMKMMPVYIYFVKGEEEKPVDFLGDVLVNRPRYVIYQMR